MMVCGNTMINLELCSNLTKFTEFTCGLFHTDHLVLTGDKQASDCSPSRTSAPLTVTRHDNQRPLGSCPYQQNTNYRGIIGIKGIRKGQGRRRPRQTLQLHFVNKRPATEQCRFQDTQRLVDIGGRHSVAPLTTTPYSLPS